MGAHRNINCGREWGVIHSINLIYKLYILKIFIKNLLYKPHWPKYLGGYGALGCLHLLIIRIY